MKYSDAQTILAQWDKKSRYVYSLHDLTILFGENGSKLKQSLFRFVRDGLLIHATRNTYVYAFSKNIGAYTIEDITVSLRRHDYNYLSYESALSDLGLISQIPIDRLTVATTGRKGEFVTPFGVIEFTHTERNPLEIVRNTTGRPPHPLRIANATFALQNLKDSGRNLDLVHYVNYEHYEDLENYKVCNIYKSHKNNGTYKEYKLRKDHKDHNSCKTTKGVLQWQPN